MASEVSRLKSIDLENTVVRNPRVGLSNRPTSRTIESGATGPARAVEAPVADGVYTGERDVNTDYLVQGTISGNIILGTGNLEFQEDKITNVQGLNGIEPGDSIKHGDIVRMDGDTDFYGVTGIEGSTIWLQEKNTSFTGPNPGRFQLRKNKLNSVHFEYIKSNEGEDKFSYDKTKARWTYTGVEAAGPIIAKDEYDNYIPDDPIRFKFLPSNTDVAPDLTHVDTTAPDPQDAYGKKVLSGKLSRDTAEIALNPIPYPDDNQNFKVYWGPVGDVQEKTKDVDYTVNYTSDPDFTSAKPPYEDRTTAYIFFMNKLNDVLQVRSIGLGFEGLFTLHEPFVSESSNEARAVTNIFPNAKELTVEGDPRQFTGEIIKVGSSVARRFFDYNIEYDSGIVNFVEHSNMEPVVRAIIHPQQLIWDGVSVIKGVGEDNLKKQDGSDLVIPYGIGLTGINGPVFYEDTDENNLTKDDDYIFEYSSGAFKLNTPLKPDESVLVSYFVEGADIEKEELELESMRVRKYPVIESSVSIKKSFKDEATGKTGIKILVEGVDFTMHYLTGRVVLLNTSITEGLQQLEVTYTPFSQINVILQPITDNPDLYRMTVIDDVVDTVDPFNLKFAVRNKSVSVPVDDPFGEEETIYDGSLLLNSLQNIKALGEPGYGLENLTPSEMYAIGLTGLQKMGLDEKLGKTKEEFYDLGITGVAGLGVETDKSVNYITTGYEYSDEAKEIQLDVKFNGDKPRPDVNDLIVATYSYESDLLPYAPVQVVYPILDEGDTSILIEGFDRTDTIRPGMILRIDNLTPKNSYYFRVKSVSYDGFNTTVELYGSFVEDINNPTFQVLDDSIVWEDLPDELVIDPNVSSGSDTLVFTGFTLETLNLMRSNALVMVDGEDVYEVLTAEASDSTLTVKIFPELKRPFPSRIQVSPPIYEVDDTDIQPFFPLITDPEHPAFKVHYRQPTNAIFGFATVYIDPETISLVEVVDGQSQSYEYKISSYGDMRTLANAIKNTKSVLDPSKYDYYPFSLEDDQGEEQYFLGNGWWSSNLVIPFEGADPVVIPQEGHLITITQEMFKYILIRCERNVPSFLIEEKDRTDLFHDGNLLAFRDKATGDLSFFEVSGSSTEEEEVDYQEDPLIHTRVGLKDKFRDNMVAPIMYKYDGLAWQQVSVGFVAIDYDESKVTFDANSELFRVGSMLKFSGKFVFQIRAIEYDSGTVILTLDPEILQTVRLDQGVEVSDMPIFLDTRPPQKYFPISYTLPEGRSGSAYVESDDESITIIEQLDGSPERSYTIQFERYNEGLAQLARAIEVRGVILDGVINVSIDPWEEYYKAEGTKLRLVPTNGRQALSYTYEVSEPAFRVNYNPTVSGVASDILLPPGTNTIQLREWRIDDRRASERVVSVPYSGRTLDQLVAAINSAESLLTPNTTPWSVDEQAYDTYYGSVRPTYYDVVPFAVVDPLEAQEFPYTVNTTQNFESWTQLGILNRNVLVEDTDYTVEGTGVTLERGMQAYERYELNYLGLDNLAAQEGAPISATCRYFYAIPKGYQIDVYMDFLSPDQFYLQKLTERNFIEIVSIPQIKQILQQAGGSVGMGTDNGSDNEPRNWNGGLVDLYYQLQDEKIKKEIYLKIFHWYKHRLRNFAAEAELILGPKFGHSNFLGVKSNGQYSLETQYVEDEDYTLTKDEDLDQIQNGFSQFFPVGYKGDAPLQYPRFGNEYQLSNEVFCFNVAYLNSAGTKVERQEGRVIAQGALLSDEIDPNTGFSDLDFDILPYTNSTSPVVGTIRRSYVFDFDRDIYSTASSLATAINKIQSSPTNVSGAGLRIFSAEVSSDFVLVPCIDFLTGSNSIPDTFQAYIEDEDSGIVRLENVLTLSLYDETSARDFIVEPTYFLGNRELRIEFEEKVNLYIVPFDKEEKTFRATHENFKFLKRIGEGDEVKISGKKRYYKIKSIDRVEEQAQKVQIIYQEQKGEKKPLLYDDSDPTSVVMGIYTDDKGNESTTAVYRTDLGIDAANAKVPYYRVVAPTPPYERMVFDDGKYFTEKEIRTFHFQNGVWVRPVIVNRKPVMQPVLDEQGNTYSIERLERSLPKDGQNIFVRRGENSDFPVPFVAWDDEFSIGSMARGSKIVDHKTGTDRIRKTFSFSTLKDFLTYSDEYFTVQEGTYDPITGDFVARQNIQINLKYLNLREEHKVSDVLEAIRYNLTGFRFPIVFPFPPFTIPPFFVKISNTHEKRDGRGADKHFYVGFERYYDADADAGYEEGLVFRGRDRNTWFRFGFRGGDTDVTDEYGFTTEPIYKNFYYPPNLYMLLLLEKQFWLAQMAILKDLFDTNNKIKRAFKVQVGPENITVSSGSPTLPLSEFSSYLDQVSDALKGRLEAYAEHLRFLRDQSDTEHQYLVDNTSGPLYRTMMEDEAPSGAIERSYEQAAQAYNNYSVFEGERGFHWDVNNWNNLKWNKDYCRWSLSLEGGAIFQEQAKEMRDSGSFLDMGFWSFPGISFEIVDYGDTPPFTLSDPEYRVLYNIMPNTGYASDQYDSAYLQVRYTIAEEKDFGIGCISGSEPKDLDGIPIGREITERCFALKDYETLQDLVDALNASLLTPESGRQVIRASVAFDYNPYRDYSTRWILKNYRSTQNNESNGPDGGGDGWTPLDDPNVDSQLYVGNVADHRQYDARVFFLNRQYGDTLRIQNEANNTALPGHTEAIPTGFENVDNETVQIWPYYMPSEGKEILGEDKLGRIPLSGRWATEVQSGSTTATQDYTTQFEVIRIDLDSFFKTDGGVLRDYRFLDYARGEEQLPGSEAPRNPLYEMSEEEIRQQFGYDYTTRNIITPKGENSKLLALVENSVDIQQQQPESEVIRRVKIFVTYPSQVDRTNRLDFEFEFDLRKNSTIQELVTAINAGSYDAARIYDQQGNLVTGGPDYELLLQPFFTAEIVGDTNIQGPMKTVDIVTRYIPQEIHIDSHRYYPKIVTDAASEIEESSEFYTDEPINENYQVGWILREEGFLPGSVVRLRVDPRTYSPNSRYRFIPNNADVARQDILAREGKDILAFDLYSWDDNAAYKIENNVLYMRSASVLEGSVEISLLDEGVVGGSDSQDHPEKRFKLIELIQKINLHGVAKQKFFANLRFGRRSASDYEYTYLPDTAQWYGGDGWVPIEKADRDTLYLDIDTALLLSSEGGDALYTVDPVLSPFPVTPDPDTVYKSDNLHLEADVRAFKLTPNTTDYTFTTREYTVDQTAQELTIDADYQTTVNGSSVFTLASYVDIDALATAINNATDSGSTPPGASIFVASKVGSFPSGVPATNLVQAPNNSLPGTLLADYTVDTPYSKAFDLTNASYDTITEIINAINSEVVSTPTGGDQPFVAGNAGISGLTPSVNLDNGSGAPPVTLTASSVSAINLSANTGSDFQILTPTWSVAGNTLTLSCTVREYYTSRPAINVSMDTSYTGQSYTVSGGVLTLNWTRVESNVTQLVVDLTVDTTLVEVGNRINSWNPNGSDQAFSAVAVWIYPFDLSSNLIEVTSETIPAAGTYVRTRGEYDVPLYEGGSPRTIRDIATEINGTTAKTGFSVDITTSEYIGYKEFRADYFVPVTALTPIGTSTPLLVDLRLTPGIYVLNMSYTTQDTGSTLLGAEPGTLTVTATTLTAEKENRSISFPAFSTNSYSYTGLQDKNLKKFINAAMDLSGTLEDPGNLSYASGILKMDVALMLAENVTYGMLRNRQKSPSPAANKSPSTDTIEMFTNDPEQGGNHVYFGFMGDIRFWQISDYNIYRQYVLVKRRLGLPWISGQEDYYVSNDLYKFENFFHNLHENDKFLNYLKFTRFGQLTDSIRFERLVQNKYLWLFLKLHRELGCDQRIQYLMKKIEEDEEKARQLK